MTFGANAGQSRPWTKLGSNTNSVLDLDVVAVTNSENLANVDIVQNEGINAQVRHECHMWLDYTDPIDTKPFDWPVIGDFTVMVNAANVTLAADPGNVDIDVMGSVDGTTYVKLADGLTWYAATAATQVDSFVYDYDASGRMPYMLIRFDCGTNNDNRHKPIKIVVMAH